MKSKKDLMKMDILCETILVNRYRLHTLFGYKIPDLKWKIGNDLIVGNLVTCKEFVKAWDYLTQEGLI